MQENERIASIGEDLTFSGRAAGTLLLDPLADRRLHGVSERCNELLYGLNLVRKLSKQSDWNNEVRALREHPAFAELLDVPLNARCVFKPRGYAGDAVSIDLLYDIEPVQHDDPWVHAVSAWLRSIPGSQAVNARRAVIADVIAELVARKPGASVLSVACGHVREVELLSDATLSNIGRLVCLDQDARSLATAVRDYPNAPLETIEGSVREILRGKLANAGTFDFIYTAGLYDYLDARVAKALTARLAAMLAPGGRLLIANFAPQLPDIALMEVMDWNLIYRTDDDMRALAPESENYVVSTPALASPNLVWLEVCRTG